MTWRTRKHGESGGRGRVRTVEYAAWFAMNQRCYRRTHESYKYYGGRGIRVCSQWRASYENFLTDLGRRPSTKHSLERRDNDGDYTPENCYWAPRSEQARNRRDLGRAPYWRRISTHPLEYQLIIPKHLPQDWRA